MSSKRSSFDKILSSINDFECDSMGVIERFRLVFECMKAVSRNVENKDQILHSIAAAIVGTYVYVDKNKKLRSLGELSPSKVSEAMVSLMILNAPVVDRSPGADELEKKAVLERMRRLSSSTTTTTTRETKTNLEREQSHGLMEIYEERVINALITNRYIRCTIQTCCCEDEKLSCGIVAQLAHRKKFEINKVVTKIKNRCAIPRRQYRCFLRPNVRKLLELLGFENRESGEIIPRLESRKDESEYHDEIEKILFDDSFYKICLHGIEVGSYVHLRYDAGAILWI